MFRCDDPDFDSENLLASVLFSAKKGDCSIATGADSKIARQEQGESTWDPLNASELAPNSANGLIPSLIAWAKGCDPKMRSCFISLRMLLC
jgi:hypothetical protein